MKSRKTNWEWGFSSIWHQQLYVCACKCQWGSKSQVKEKHQLSENRSLWPVFSPVACHWWQHTFLCSDVWALPTDNYLRKTCLVSNRLTLTSNLFMKTILKHNKKNITKLQWRIRLYYCLTSLPREVWLPLQTETQWERWKKKQVKTSTVKPTKL